MAAFIPLYTALQSLFTDTPLMLSGVMLADYGQGFTRHGAWSTWLSEHYHLCPALANTLTPHHFPNYPLAVLLQTSLIRKLSHQPAQTIGVITG